MYSENSNRSSRRGNDEFLRRMVGGELIGKELPAMSMARMENAHGNPSERPSCNQNDDIGSECPTVLGAPSLAMVYSPKQCWRNLLDNEAALKNGSLFAELILPFEGSKCRKETEVRPCR